MKFLRISLTIYVTIFITLFSVNFSYADGQHDMDSAGVSLGKVDFPISCASAVQGRFNRSVALLHHMMYGQAEKTFKAVAKADPTCAMAQWGIAMTHFHPLWAPPNEVALQKGSDAVEKAKALKSPNPREQAYVDAVETFYKNWKAVKHTKRITAWDTAQKKVHKAYPDDIDAGAFYALSHLASAEKGDKTFTHQKWAGKLLEELHAKAPEHPGLFHYTIHAYDNPVLAHRAVKVARGYLKLAPDIPHALHMPSHIFVRLGLWDDVIAWNTRSAAVAKKLSIGKPVSLHYIHAVDYLMYAHLQQAQDKKAQQILATINGIKNYQDSFASAYGIAAAQSRYSLERRQWGDAAVQEVRTHKAFPWDKYPWHESILYFTRGLGSARRGDSAGAAKAIKTLDIFYARAQEAGQNYWAVHLDAQRKTVLAWAAFSEGKKDQALKMMRQAADIEDSVDKHPVTPGAVLPARELLGDMLMLLKKHHEAIEAYGSTLTISPNRFNSLYGAGRAAEQAGDLGKAKSYYRKLVQLTEKETSKRPQVKKAEAFLAKN